MSEGKFTTPEEWAEILDRATRHGDMVDDPEGTRWIQISDTLARQMAASLRRARDHYHELFSELSDVDKDFRS